MRFARGLYLVQTLLFLAASTSTLKVENNGYKDVVASISRSVQSERSQETVEYLKYVLVLDTSGSMNENGRLDRLKRITTNWLLYDQPPNETVKVGMVTFSQKVHQRTNGLEENINNLVNKINTLVGNGLSYIANGILEGIDMLDGPYNQDKGGVMILITDSDSLLMQEYLMSERHLIRRLQEQSIKIIILDLGNMPSEKWKNFAVMTQGKYYFIDNAGLTGSNYDEYNHNSTFQSNVAQSKAYFRQKKLISFQDRSITFYIDKEIGKDVQVGLNILMKDKSKKEKRKIIKTYMTFRVTFPNGSVVEQPVVKQRTTLFFDGDLPVGQYIAEPTFENRKNPIVIQADIEVISKQQNNQTLTLETFYYSLEDYFLGEDGKVYASVYHGDYRVLGANVECYYQRDTEVPKRLSLVENSQGLYHQAFDKTINVEDSRFFMMCQVKGDDTTSFLDDRNSKKMRYIS